MLNYGEKLYVKIIKKEMDNSRLSGRLQVSQSSEELIPILFRHEFNLQH